MPNSGSSVSNSPYKGKPMQHMVHARMAPTPAGAYNPSYVPLDANESKRAQAIAANMRTQSFQGNTLRRMVLPTDGNEHDEQKKAQAGRTAEWRRQASMPWLSHFMQTPTDAQRLNNPAQASAFKQRQLTVPNTYGQFYAFMRAM